MLIILENFYRVGESVVINSDFISDIYTQEINNGRYQIVIKRIHGLGDRVSKGLDIDEAVKYIQYIVNTANSKESGEC